MEYKKTGNVRLKQGSGKTVPVPLRSKGSKLAAGSQLGNDSRKGLDIKPARVR